MRSVSLRLEDLQKVTIPIGFVGENEHTRVLIDCKKMYEEYPTAAASMTVRPPKGEAYPAVVVRDGDIVIWDVTDSDLIQDGIGEIQLGFSVSPVEARSFVGQTRIWRSIMPTGEIPEPLANFLTQAGAALTLIPETINQALADAKASGEFDGEDGFSPEISITDITGGHRLTVTTKDGSFTVDVMDGEKGDPGDPGDPGQPGSDGVSPTVAISDITGGHRVTVTDKRGDHSFDVMDGEKGDPGNPGQPGSDGVSPTVSISKSGKTTTVTITDKNGTHTATILDGEDGTTAIDDTAGAGDTDKVWSADKSASELSTLNGAIDGKADEPTGTKAAGKVYGLNDNLEPEWKTVTSDNYVTPEMFGAKGDGETDDSDALNAMFASNNNVFVFSNKTYLIMDAVDCEKSCTIFFDHTIIKVNSSSHVRTFEYAIGFKAGWIRTYGRLYVKANTSVNIGIWLAKIGNSHFDILQADNARIWGIYIDDTTNGNNCLNINHISVAQNGFKAHAKAIRTGLNSLDIIDITGSFTGFNDDMRESLFDNKYFHANKIIDDSQFEAEYLCNRFIMINNNNGSAFTLDSEDLSKATFNSANTNIPSTYYSENGRNVFIPIGGGINIGSKNSEGGFSIGRLDSQSQPLSAYLHQGYGGKIGVYMTEYDTMVMHNDCLAVNIDYMYCEAIGSGYTSVMNDAYDRITLFSVNNNGRTYVNNPFVGSTRVPFVTGNAIVNNLQRNSEMKPLNVLSCPGYLAANKLVGINAVRDDNVPEMECNEFTPRNITLDSLGYSSSYNALTIDLKDLYASNKASSFDPVTIFVRRRRTSEGDNFKITLKQALINAGYTLNGAVDNVLVIHPSEYNNFVKVTVMLFRYNKKFYVTAEPLTFVDNTTT